MNSALRVLNYSEATDSATRVGLLVRIMRRRRLFAVVFGLVMGLAVVALAVLPARYLATGSVIVAEQEPGVPNPSVAWAQKIGDPADLESQLIVIHSPRVLRIAMENPDALEAALKECRYNSEHSTFSWLAGLTGGPGCDKLKPGSDALLDYMQSRYRIGSVGRSRVINISYQSPLPDVAQTLANALIKAFLDDHKRMQSSNREAAAAWIWQELRQLDTDLREQDARIQAFRRTKGLMRGANAPITSERLTSISQQLAVAETARAEALARLQEINADRARGAADSPPVLASRAVSDLKQQISTVTGQLASATSTLGPQHPSLQSLQQERETLEKRLAKEVASVAASAKRTYDAADALVTSLKQQMETTKGEVAAATADEASIESMVRRAEIKRLEYSELYKRASELETERRVLLGSTRLVNFAEYPNKPYFPKRLPFLAGGFTLALLAAFAAALVRDRSDRSVRSSSELAIATRTPIFAQLPSIASRSIPFLGFLFRRGTNLPIKQGLNAARRDPLLRDALRKLYASIALAGNLKPLRTILITSPGPQEGKTFTTLALAQLVAATGRRVLVIECDMRRPTFAAALDLPASPGVAAVLRGDVLPRNAVVPTGTLNLDAIPAGPPTTDSTELLIESRMADLLRWAEFYDLVLLDSPPSDILMDACMLARRVDGVLCCARWGHSSVATAAATISGIRAAGGQVFCVVATMVERNEQSLYERSPSPTVNYLGAT